MENCSICFQKVSKIFGKIKALDNISFCVPKGKITGLIGSNGSGKTTSLKCLLGFYDDYIGTITIDGESSKEIIDSQQLISYIPDKTVLYEELTVNEHFSFISAMYGSEDRIDNLIDKFSLSPHLDKFPHELSKGTAQKVLIGCALLRNFDILVADEPFEGLDPIQIVVVKNIFEELRDSGKTILVSTHLLSIIEPICDNYIMLDQGTLLASGNIKSVLSKTPNCNNLEELYIYLSGSGD